MKECDYTGDKVKNQFTAYLQGFVRSKPYNYLKKKISINDKEKPLRKNIQIDYSLNVEEMMEKIQKEELLFKEQQGFYPEWNKLSDQKLIDSLMQLNEMERRLIYQHVFEERTFKEIGLINEFSSAKVKNIYYYAIRKIRCRMGGKK